MLREQSLSDKLSIDYFLLGGVIPNCQALTFVELAKEEM